jgi:transposase
MNASLQFDPAARQLTGPAGSLPIADSDELARRFLMLQEGQCLDTRIVAVAQKYGYCRQRYYQILDAFQKGGLLALQPRKTGPKSNYRRTDQVVRQILRHRFLDPEASPEVIAQKLRQTHFSISLRSIERVIADYGLQKKTLLVEPQKPATAATRPTRRKTPAPGKGRRRQSGASGPPTSGR